MKFAQPNKGKRCSGFAPRYITELRDKLENANATTLTHPQTADESLLPKDSEGQAQGDAKVAPVNNDDEKLIS